MPWLAKKGELRGTALLILNIGARWVWVVMTISWPLYPHPTPKEPRYPVCTILDGPQGRSSRIWISENLVFPPGFQLLTVRPVTSDYLLRPPGPAHMPAYFRTLDPNTVTCRRY